MRYERTSSTHTSWRDFEEALSGATWAFDGGFGECRWCFAEDDIEADQRAGSGDTGDGFAVSIAFKTTPQLWLNMQQNYDLWRAQKTAKGLKGIRSFAA
jgi:hypothetical protein